MSQYNNNVSASACAHGSDSSCSAPGEAFYYNEFGGSAGPAPLFIGVLSQTGNAQSDSASRFASSNHFAALRHPQLHNQVSLPESPIFFPEYLVRKNKNYKVTGNMSEGPSPNHITRAGIVTARM